MEYDTYWRKGKEYLRQTPYDARQAAYQEQQRAYDSPAARRQRELDYQWNIMKREIITYKPWTRPYDWAKLPPPKKVVPKERPKPKKVNRNEYRSPWTTPYDYTKRWPKIPGKVNAGKPAPKKRNILFEELLAYTPEEMKAIRLAKVKKLKKQFSK